MKNKIILVTVLFLSISLWACKDEGFYTMSLENNEKSIKTTFTIKDKDGKVIKDAYIVTFRELGTLHIRTGEGASDANGVMKITDRSNTTKGYANIAAPGYNSKKVMLDLKEQGENQIEVVLDNQNTIKIMSYNIEEGFKNSQKGRDNFAKWVKTYDPDIILLQEMMHFDDVSFAKFAESYGHSHAVLSKTTGIPTAITSKEPIKNIRKVIDPQRLHHGYVYGESFGINIYSVHLCPYELDNDRNKNKIDRLDEMKIILQDAKQHSNSSTIIGGDFNSHNKFDSDSYGPGYNYVNRDHQVTNLCKTENYFDAYPFLNKQFKGTWPTSHISVNGTNKGCRLDYIMLNNKAKDKCTYSDIVQSIFTDDASDHYPMFIEIAK